MSVESKGTTQTSTPFIAMPKSREIAVVALFSALSIILTLISNYVLRLVFVPPVSYLLFDFGEIPAILCFLILGPKAGLSVAVVEWITLNLMPSSAPLIGPLFKLLSVGSTMIGIWVAWKLAGNRNLKVKFTIAGFGASISRAGVMTVFNAALLFSYGLSPSPLFYYILYLTAIFNILHVVLDVIPSYLVLELAQVRLMLRKNGMTWFERGVRK
ncbi:MAG: ECF transporter S component [Nitrososphaerales archaeon]